MFVSPLWNFHESRCAYVCAFKEVSILFAIDGEKTISFSEIIIDNTLKCNKCECTTCLYHVFSMQKYQFEWMWFENFSNCCRHCSLVLLFTQFRFLFVVVLRSLYLHAVLWFLRMAKCVSGHCAYLFMQQLLTYTCVYVCNV